MPFLGALTRGQGLALIPPQGSEVSYLDTLMPLYNLQRAARVKFSNAILIMSFHH